MIYSIQKLINSHNFLLCLSMEIWYNMHKGYLFLTSILSFLHKKENLVFDALNDPIMGNMIESTRSKCKKFKPWLMIGILLISIK